jgi:hypothetical protein
LRLLSFCCFSIVYLYRPKSMILHTGGWAVGETMTRSKPFSLARFKAWRLCNIPSCSPSASITLTSRYRRQRSLTGGPGSGRGWSLLKPAMSCHLFEWVAFWIKYSIALVPLSCQTKRRTWSLQPFYRTQEPQDEVTPHQEPNAR